MTKRLSDSYIRVLWTCQMGDACTNDERPGTHDEYLAASRCSHAKKEASLADREPPSEFRGGLPPVVDAIKVAKLGTVTKSIVVSAHLSEGIVDQNVVIRGNERDLL